MRKGFTLMELLGVIIILALISLISVPPILEYIDKAKRSSYKTSVQNLMENVKEYVSKNEYNNDFPKEGISVLNEELNLKKNNFKSGVIKRNEEGEIEAVNVYNGVYCANGLKNSLIVEQVNSEEECNNIDTTKPDLKIKISSITSNKIVVVAIASDIESGIKDYKYCIGDECSDYILKNNYEFNNLKSGKTYEITVKVRNNNSGKDEQYSDSITTIEEKIKITTKSLEEPTFEISSNSYSGSKEVKIKYGEIINNYIYGYEFVDNDGNKEDVKVNTSETLVKLNKNGTLKAYIRTNNEEISNELLIMGIDESGPKIYVIMNDNWETSKQLEIIAEDNGSGLSSKPYSYDGGNSWTSNNKRTYTSNEKIELVVRDKMGNKTTNYFICSDEDLTNCKESNEIIISKVDADKPTCELKGIGLEGQKNWFRSDVDIEISYKDVVLDYQGNEIEGSGVVRSEIDQPKLSDEGTYIVNGIVEDAVGNVGTCSLEIGIDKTPPTIDIKISGTAYGSGYTSGSKVTVTCKDNNDGVNGSKNVTLNSKGTNTVNGLCTDIAGNTISDSKSYIIYVYTADASCGYASCWHL